MNNNYFIIIIDWYFVSSEMYPVLHYLPAISKPIIQILPPLIFINKVRIWRNTVRLFLFYRYLALTIKMPLMLTFQSQWMNKPPRLFKWTILSKSCSNCPSTKPVAVTCPSLVSINNVGFVGMSSGFFLFPARFPWQYFCHSFWFFSLRECTNSLASSNGLHESFARRDQNWDDNISKLLAFISP